MTLKLREKLHERIPTPSEIRQQTGLSGVRLAELAEVSERTWWRWEAANEIPRYRYQALRLNLAELKAAAKKKRRRKTK